MKALNTILRFIFLICFLALPACTSSNSESLDDVMDETDDNQVNAPSTDAAPDTSDIPNPEQVSKEVAEAESAVDDADGTLVTEPMPAGDQKEIETIIQAEESAQQQMGKAPSNPQSVPVAVAPEDSDAAIGSSLGAPSLADVAAGNDQAAPSKKSHSKSSKKKAKEPKAPKPPVEAVNEGNFKVYIVQPGDNLGRIARLIYGARKRWNDIARVNGLDAKGSIYPGDSLKYSPDEQSAGFESKWEALKRNTITVQQNETLSSIARRVMGNKDYWKLLWRWNEEAIANPHTIAPGQTLTYVSKEDLTAFANERNGESVSH